MSQGTPGEGDCGSGATDVTHRRQGDSDAIDRNVRDAYGGNAHVTPP